MLSDKIHASNECRLIYHSLLYIIVGICMKTLFLGNESCFGCFDGLSYIIIITPSTGTGLTRIASLPVRLTLILGIGGVY